MNYQKIYDALIQKRRNFPLNKIKGQPGAVEYHHIIPVACGGDPIPARAINNVNGKNLVGLTPKEHFLAHWLLAKIYFGTCWHESTTRAFQLICNTKTDVRHGKNNGIRINSKTYENIRLECAKLDASHKRGTRVVHDPITLINKMIPKAAPLPDGYVEGKYFSPEALARIGEATAKRTKGKKASPETRAKQSAAGKGRKLSEQNKANISKALKGHIVTAETRKLISVNTSKAEKGRRWYTNGIINKFVKPENAPTGVEWKLGFTPKAKKSK